ncbi:MAG: hypothetical protein WBO39_00415, partial [Ferruginibacter sp.]
VGGNYIFGLAHACKRNKHTKKKKHLCGKTKILAHVSLVYWLKKIGLTVCPLLPVTAKGNDVKFCHIPVYSEYKSTILTYIIAY